MVRTFNRIYDLQLNEFCWKQVVVGVIILFLKRVSTFLDKNWWLQTIYVNSQVDCLSTSFCNTMMYINTDDIEDD